MTKKVKLEMDEDTGCGLVIAGVIVLVGLSWLVDIADDSWRATAVVIAAIAAVVIIAWRWLR